MSASSPVMVEENDKSYTEKIAHVHSQDRSDAEIEGQIEDERGQDEALKFTAQHVEVSEEAARRVRRKIDLHMLPWYAQIPQLITIA